MIWNQRCWRSWKRARGSAGTRLLLSASRRERCGLVFLLLEFRPASVERVYFVLCGFHFRVGSEQARAIAGDGGVFELFAFGLRHVLGGRNSLLDGVVLAGFEVGELLLRLNCRCGGGASLRSRFDLSRLIAFFLPGFPL